MRFLAVLVIAALVLLWREVQLFGAPLVSLDVATLTADDKLKDKTATEKADLKSTWIVEKAVNETYTMEGFNIEILDIKKIPGGVQLLARAWNQDGVVGFSDGTVEIERFNFYNPPILIQDPNGNLSREFKSKAHTDIVKYREDPREAIKEALAHTIKIVAKPGTNVILGKVGNTTSTFYPDPDVETSSVDGWLRRLNTSGESFTAVRTGSGTSAQPSDGNGTVNLEAHSSTNNYIVIDRTVTIFDTSSIPDSDTISSATISYFGYGGKPDGLSQSVNITSFTASSLTNLVTGNYAIANFGSTDFSTDKGITASWSNSAYNDFSLNANGIANIDKDSLSTGDTLSKFALRTTADIDNTAPTWSASAQSAALMRLADTVGTTNDPKLVVEHAAAASATPVDTTYFEIADE